MLLGGGDGLLVRRNGGKVHAGVFLDGLDHGHPLPVAQVDVLALVGDLQGAADLHGHGLHHFFHQIHHAVEIGVGLVQLNGGKLRVVGGIHALIAENPAYLVDPIHAAHNQPLQVQLSLNAQHHVNVQGVVMGIEGTGGGTDFKGGQNGGVYLQEALAVQEMPQLPENQAPLDEGVLHLGIYDQVYITLTVPGFPVGQTVKLFRQRQQGLAQQRGLVDTDGDFAPLGFEHVAHHTDDVADVVLLEPLEGGLLHFVELHIQLNPAGAVLQIAEGHLAHAPLAHNTAGQTDGLARHGIVVFFDGGGVGGHFKLGLDEGVEAVGTQSIQLFPTHPNLIGQGHFRLGYKLCHGSALTGDADHLHGEGAGRGVDGEGFAGGLAHHAPAEGGVVGELALHGVGFLGTGDPVGGLNALLILHDHGAAQAYPAGGLVFVLNDDGVGQDVLDFGDPAVELGLLVLGGIILGVFGQVAVGTGFRDHGGNLTLPGGLQIVQFLFQVGKTQTGNLKFLCHIQNPFSEINSIVPNIIVDDSPTVKEFFGKSMNFRKKGGAERNSGVVKAQKPENETVIANQSADWCGNPFQCLPLGREGARRADEVVFLIFPSFVSCLRGTHEPPIHYCTIATGNC